MRRIFALMETKELSLSQTMETHIAACKVSGQTVVDYCNNHQLKVHQYYYWQKKLQPQQSNFIKMSPVIPTVPMSIFFTNGTQVNFATLPPVDYLKNLLN
ncbi:MAG: IS66 family insertion sequence element accessory protein TnpA [Ferruginibacter sp.]